MEAAEPDYPEIREELSQLRVALVHYWLVTWRGGEKVIESILKIFPKADVYTLFYDKGVCGPYLTNRNIYTSNLDRPFLRKHYQKLFPFYPTGIRSLKLKKPYDLIVSSESGPAKGISNPNGIPHVCYIHSPMRYCWGQTQTYLDVLPKWSRPIAKRQFDRLREWDRTTIENVDLYIANSKNVARRVNKYYQREAEICYPPIALDLFDNSITESTREYYLSFGAVTPAKNIALLVEAFNQIDKKLIIIGSGSEELKLRRLAKENICFTGELPLDQVIQYIQSARAMVFPGEEDFGMAPLEVMSQGVPVIALGQGGALESIVENVTKPQESSGLFFKEPTIKSLLNAITQFEEIESRFDPIWIRGHARKFGEDVFQQQFCRLVHQQVHN